MKSKSLVLPICGDSRIATAMKHGLALLLAALLPLPASGGVEATPESFRSDLVYATAEALYDAMWLHVFENVKTKKLTFAGAMRTELRARALAEAADRFLVDFPADPRAWKVLVWAVDSRPSFNVGFKPADDESDISTFQNSVIRDPEAKEAWEARLLEHANRVSASAHGDLTPDAREGLAFVRARLALTAAFAASDKGEVVDVAELRRKVREFVDVAEDREDLLPEQVDKVMSQDNFRLAYGDEPRRRSRRAGVVGNYFYLLEQLEPQSVAIEATPFLTSRSGYIRKVAEAKLASAAVRAAPVDLKFTAIDGRAVDLASLRGRPVLLEFWATWCGPCIAQIPHLKKLYAEYHALGLCWIGSTQLALLRGYPAMTIWQHDVSTGRSGKLDWVRLPEREMLNALAWDADGGELQVFSARSLYRISPDKRTMGEAEPVRVAFGQSPAIDARASRLAMVSESITEPPEIAIYDLKRKSTDRLTRLNPQLDRLLLGTVERLRVETESGVGVTGFLVHPVGEASGRRYPLIIATYGFFGKFITDAEWHSSFPAQALAGQGYAVLLLNVPGTAQMLAGDPERARQIEGWNKLAVFEVGSSRVDLQACKLEYSIVSPK